MKRLVTTIQTRGTLWLVSLCLSIYSKPCLKRPPRGASKSGRKREVVFRTKSDSVCVELSVHEKTVVKSRWSLNTEVAYTRFYCVIIIMIVVNHCPNFGRTNLSVSTGLRLTILTVTTHGTCIIIFSISTNNHLHGPSFPCSQTYSRVVVSEIRPLIDACSMYSQMMPR